MSSNDLDILSTSKSLDFTSAYLKVQWAQVQINSLNEVINGFLESDFYTFSNERDPETGQYRISITSKAYPPADIYLLLGDAIHNLRTALDHAATAIVGSGDFVYFPFHERLENLVSSEGTIVCSKTKAIEGAVRDLGRFIVNEIKPYRAGNPFLWKLTKLDAIDKHKFLIPAISLTSVTAYDLYDAENRNSIGQLTGTVGPGGTVNLVGSTGQFKVRGKIEPTFQVLFTKETFFDGLPVVETLVNAANAVSETLRRIEEFIRRADETSI